jgi:hypothetical protein
MRDPLPVLGTMRRKTGKEAEMHIGDLWDRLGLLEDYQTTQVLADLFIRFEQRRQQCPDDPAAEAFFQILAGSMAHVQSCNVSRR